MLIKWMKMILNKTIMMTITSKPVNIGTYKLDHFFTNVAFGYI